MPWRSPSTPHRPCSTRPEGRLTCAPGSCAPARRIPLHADPVRILRGVRLAAALGLKIQPETRKLMRLAVPLLPTVSAERLRDELFRILEGPRPAACLRALDILGALAHILPEVTGLKGVQQSQPHVYDAWTHTMDIVQRLAEVLAVLGLQLDEQRAQNWAMGLLSLRLGRFRQNIYQHFSQTHLNLERSLTGVIFLGALFHDSGKRSTRKEDGEGRVRFFGHEQAGVELAIHRARALRLSNAEIDRLAIIVRQHMRPLLLAHSEEGISRRAVYRFFRDCGPAGVEICLLALADTLATYGPALPSEVWVKQVDVVRIAPGSLVGAAGRAHPSGCAAQRGRSPEHFPPAARPSAGGAAGRAARSPGYRNRSGPGAGFGMGAQPPGWSRLRV